MPVNGKPGTDTVPAKHRRDKGGKSFLTKNSRALR